jgi:hypothetical protein
VPNLRRNAIPRRPQKSVRNRATDIVEHKKLSPPLPRCPLVATTLSKVALPENYGSDNRSLAG